MIVEELITELQKQNPKAEVDAEGCDCINKVQSVEVPTYDTDRVLIGVRTPDGRLL